MEKTAFEFDVFLSHNERDKPRVRKLAERLREAGLRVWFDQWEIQPGDDICLQVERGLEASRIQVLCLSPTALSSAWVTLERNTILFRATTNSGRRVEANYAIPNADFRQTSTCRIPASGNEPRTRRIND